MKNFGPILLIAWIIGIKWIETKHSTRDRRFKLGLKPGSMTLKGWLYSIGYSIILFGILTILIHFKFIPSF